MRRFPACVAALLALCGPLSARDLTVEVVGPDRPPVAYRVGACVRSRGSVGWGGYREFAMDAPPDADSDGVIRAWSARYPGLEVVRGGVEVLGPLP